MGIPPALARKRRMEFRKLQRSAAQTTRADEDSGTETDESYCKRMRVHDDDCSDIQQGSKLSQATLASIRGVKKLSRYDPGVAMTKEELTLWRKEARRVRNRESASASREKTRHRIDELEVEVDTLKSRYAAALHRIVQLEAQAAAAASGGSFTPARLSSLQNGVATPVPPGASTAQSQHMPPHPVSPPLSPRHYDDFSPLDIDEGEICYLSGTVMPQHEKEANKNYQHIIHSISRPEA
jgi:hypothetical protein